MENFNNILDTIIKVLVSIVIPAIPIVIAWRSFPGNRDKTLSETNKTDAEAVDTLVSSAKNIIAEYRSMFEELKEKYDNLDTKFDNLNRLVVLKENENRRLHKILISLVAGIRKLIDQITSLGAVPDWTIPPAVESEVVKEMGKEDE